VSFLRSGVLFFAPEALTDDLKRSWRKTQQGEGTSGPSPTYSTGKKFSIS
jgi:hypothetical protein